LPEIQNKESVVSDGTFTQPFSNGGLGWRWDDIPGASIDFDMPPQGAAGRSIRLDFGGGQNIGLSQPSQIVIVKPGKTYDFHAQMKTLGITTDSGVRFELVDPNSSGKVQAVTENLTGTHPWTDESAAITTSDQTHFLRIAVIREPSRLFENRLKGTAWIANISLAPRSGKPAAAAP